MQNFIHSIIVISKGIFMAEWMFDQSGQPKIILDNDTIRNKTGHLIAWINDSGIYNLYGQHIGWYEGGVIYDNTSSVLAFIQNSSGYLPYKPSCAGSPGLPGFAGTPGKPGLSGTPGRPGTSGWSKHDVDKYLKS